MRKKWTRLLALFLSVVMAMSCLPFTAWAVESDGGSTPAGYEYVLDTDGIDDGGVYVIYTNYNTGDDRVLYYSGSGDLTNYVTATLSEDKNTLKLTATNFSANTQLWEAEEYDGGFSLKSLAADKYLKVKSSNTHVNIDVSDSQQALTITANSNSAGRYKVVQNGWSLNWSSKKFYTHDADNNYWVRFFKQTPVWAVTFTGEGVTESTTEVLDGGNVDLPDDPTREGCTFLGWFVGDDEFTARTEVNANVTVTAQWEEIIVTPEPALVRTPQDAIDEGYDVHYFIKFGGTAGKGWTFSDTAGSVTIGTGGTNATPVTGAFDDATSYQIYVGTSSYLFAPYGTAKSTAQGKYSQASTDFNIIANGDGTYKIKAEDNCFMMQKPSDFDLDGVSWKGVQFGADGDDFYITSAVYPNNGTYWIWYQTVSKTALAAKITDVKALDADRYTAESWAALQTALDGAKAVNAAADATQDEVNAALAALTGAIAVLVEKPANPEPVEKPRHYFESLANEAWMIGDGNGTANVLSAGSGNDWTDVTEVSDSGDYRVWADGGFLYFDLDNDNGKLLAKKATRDGAAANPDAPIHVEKQVSDTYIISRVHTNGTPYYLTAESQNNRAVFSPNKADAVPYFIENGSLIYCVGPYTVSFDGEGAEDIAPISAMYGTTLPTPADREGYTFQGWFNGENKFTEVTADVTLTAKWEKIPETPDDPVQTYASPAQAEAAGKVVTYLGMMPSMAAGNRHWDGVGIADRRAITLYQVAGEANAATADTAITLDADGVDSGKGYVICIPDPDTDKPAVMHYGSGDSITNQCSSVGATVAELPHLFVIEFEDGGYTIRPGSETAKYLSLTASGSQQRFVADKTIFYITPANKTNDGNYYIWTANDPQLGDAISEMMTANADNTDNTWAFVGGRAVQGSFDDIGLARTLAGQFEEYIRWEKRGGSSDGDGTPWAMQRYVTNTAYTGQTLALVVSESGWARVTALDPRAAVYMVGTEDIGSTTFETDLTSFITKSLALRDGSGFAVIIKGYDSSVSDLNAAVDTAVNALPAIQKSHVAVVDGTLTADQLTSDGYPNAKGHLELAKRLAAAVVGSTANFPTGKNDAAAIANGTWADKLTDNGVTIFGETPETLTAAQQAVKAKVDDKTTPMTWLFMGDSITHGALWAEGDGTISQDFEKFVKDDLGRTSDIVINTAVSGATSATTVREVQARLDKYSPDVVSIMIGTNDAAGKCVSVANYKTNLNTIVTAILNENAIAVLRTPIPNGANDRGNYIHEYVDAIWEFYNGLTAEQKEKVIVVDQFAQWAPYLMTADDGVGMTFLFNKVFDQDTNKIHPGPVGHLWMTQELIDGLGLWDSSKNLCKLSYQQDWGITSEDSTVSLDDAYTYDADSRTLSVSLSKLNLSGTVISAELTAGAGGETYTASYLRGQEETLTITFPEGADSAQISVSALVSVSASAGKKVSFASAEVDLTKTVEDDGKMPAPEQPECSYEYRRASGAIEPGVYMLVASTWEANSSQKCRVMHLWYNNSNQLKVDQCGTGDDGTAEILSLVHETHLIQVEEKNGGYTFKSYAGNAAGKYLTASSSGVSLGNTATVFTVTEAEDGGYYLSVDGSYISWNNNWTTSATPYRLNLYRETAVPLSMAQTEFSGTSTDGPMNENQTNSTFRIPALVTLDNGWIVAASDIRWPNTADSPNNLDTIVSVSKDGGKTWDWEIVNYFSDFAPLYGVGQKVYSASFIDPALAVDGDGTLWMAVDLQPAHVNLNQKAQKTGSGFDEKGYLMVGPISESEWETKVNTSVGCTEATRLDYQAYYEYRVDINSVDHTTDVTTTKNGKTVSLYPVFHKDTGVNTGYYVDAFFDLYYDFDEGGIKPVLVAQKESSAYIQANLFYVQSPWKAYSTTYLMIRKATVNEETGKLDWKDPMLVSGVKNFDGETFLAFCPGRGTVTTYNGKERIIFPVYDNVDGEKCSVVYSDDGGKTWTRGARIPNGEASKTSESQIVVLPDGSGGTFLRIYCRNTDATISYADSYDGGATWSSGKLDSELEYGNNTMVSFINLDGCLVDPDGTIYENLILASYPWGTKVNGENRRSNGVVRIGSFDPASKTVTWLNENEIRYEGRFNYSCVTQLLDENNKPTDGFGLLYEKDGGKGMLMIFHILTTADLLGDDWDWLPIAPVSADTNQVTLEVTDTCKIGCTVADPAATVTWTSSNAAVATVVNGLITAVSAGEAAITLSVTTLGRTFFTNVGVTVTDSNSLCELESSLFELRGDSFQVPYTEKNPMTVEEFVAGLTVSDGASVKVYNGDTEVTDQIEAGMTVKIVARNNRNSTDYTIAQKNTYNSYADWVNNQQGNVWFYQHQDGGQLVDHTTWNTEWSGWGGSSPSYKSVERNQACGSVKGEEGSGFTFRAPASGTVTVRLYNYANADAPVADQVQRRLASASSFDHYIRIYFNGTEEKAITLPTGTDPVTVETMTFTVKQGETLSFLAINGGSFTSYSGNHGAYFTPVVTYFADECIHEHVETIPGTAATCTATGLTAGTVCSVCGETITEQEVIPATGHTEQVVAGSTPTCTETGLTAGTVCSVCGETITEQEVIPAVGHTEQVVAGSTPTCTETGLTAGTVCSVCGETITEQAEIAALGHDVEQHEGKAATCTEAGWTAYETCTRCDYTTVSEEIPALGHDVEQHEGKAATCTEAGWTAYETCSRCDYTTVSEEIPALGHDVEQHEGKAATCTEAGWTAYETCSRCDHTTYEEIAALGHELTHVEAKDATYDEDGNTEYWYCETCGKYFSDAEAADEIAQADTVIPALIVPVVPVVPSTPTDPDEPPVEIVDDDPPLSELPLPFVDVAEDAWYREAVAYMFSEGMMNGVDEDRFAPQGDTTRGMIVTILYRMEKEPIASVNSFLDRLDGKWYTKAIDWAAEVGVVNGYGSGNFGADDKVTREQLVAILYRYAGMKGYDVSARADLSDYEDAAKVSSYAAEAMSWAVAEGLVQGTSETTLSPRNTATRAQIALILMRFFKDAQYV